jgi:hypothetical protein
VDRGRLICTQAGPLRTHTAHFAHTSGCVLCPRWNSGSWTNSHPPGLRAAAIRESTALERNLNGHEKSLVWVMIMCSSACYVEAYAVPRSVRG